MSDSDSAAEQDFVPFAIRCPNCQRRIKIKKAEWIGRRVACPHCQTTVRVPRDASVPPEAVSQNESAERPQVMVPLDEPSAAKFGEPEKPAPVATGKPALPAGLTLPLVLGGLGICVGLLIAILFVVIRTTAQPPQTLASLPAPVPSSADGRAKPAALPEADRPPSSSQAVAPAKKPNSRSHVAEAAGDEDATTHKEETGEGKAKSTKTPTATAKTRSTKSSKSGSSKRSDKGTSGAAESDADDNLDKHADPVGSNADKHGAGTHSNGASTIAPGGAREIIDRVGNGIVLITEIDETGRKTGLGSGFVFDDNGRILTNYHVIAQASKATAQFKDGKEYEISGYYLADKEHDLAVLQLSDPPKPLTVVLLARGAEPQQADDVVVIGHPEGYAFTVTTGIISAIRSFQEIPEMYRELVRLAEDGRWIQTTAPITHGNSGGPLLNSKGEVIGINSWIVPDTGNLAFAIHISTIEQCLKHQSRKPKPLPAPGAKPTVDSLVGKILQDFKAELFEWSHKVEKARSEVERGRLAAKNPIEIYMQKLLDLADKHRKEKVALEALSSACQLWLLDKRHTLPLLNKATERLLADHLDDEKLGDVALVLLQGDPGDVTPFLSELSTRSPHREVKAFAALAMAQQEVDALNGADKIAEAKAVAMLKRVNSEYADVRVGERTVADIIEPLLFEVEHLTVGKKAQDVKGKDVDGRSLKLTDYRNKVVVVDFFSNDLDFAPELYAHHKLFLELYHREPFQILGINVDSLDEARTAVNLKKVTWPCIWDGPQGAICEHWKITSVPRNFVIDGKGVIRYRDLYAEDLVRAVEVLLTEMNPRRTPRSANPFAAQPAPSKKRRSIRAQTGS